jgi:hypothetical protein
MAAPSPSGRSGGVAFRVRRSTDRLTAETPAWADALALLAAFAGVTLWSFLA